MQLRKLNVLQSGIATVIQSLMEMRFNAILAAGSLRWICTGKDLRAPRVTARLMNWIPLLVTCPCAISIECFTELIPRSEMMAMGEGCMCYPKLVHWCTVACKVGFYCRPATGKYNLPLSVRAFQSQRSGTHEFKNGQLVVRGGLGPRNTRFQVLPHCK